MILQALLVQILLGIALGWLDKATTGKRFKHSEWLLRHPLLVQYLLALVLNLVAVSVVYHPYREFMGSLLRTPSTRLPCWSGSNSSDLVSCFATR